MRRRTPRLAAALVVLTACGSPVADVDDPPEWEEAHTSAHWWMSVAAPAANDRWIVGGTAEEGQILHFDGTAVAIVDHGAGVPLLNWVHAFPDADVIAVGNAGAMVRGDGLSWEQIETPTDRDLWGVWGANPDDVWAVGGTPGAGPVILRDTGAGFSPVELPALRQPDVDVLFKVWGSGPDDVFIIGQRGTVLHWDGSSLRDVDAGATEDLIGIWGTGPDRVAVVGGRAIAEIALWDGESWRTLQPEGMPGLNAVWLRDDSVHVAGVAGTAAVVDFGSGRVAAEYAIPTIVFLHAIAGAPDGTLTAVGGDFSTGMGGPFLGQVFQATLPTEEGS